MAKELGPLGQMASSELIERLIQDRLNQYQLLCGRYQEARDAIREQRTLWEIPSHNVINRLVSNARAVSRELHEFRRRWPELAALAEAEAAAHQ